MQCVDGPMASDGAESNDDESEDGEGKPRPKRRSDKPAAEKPAKKAKATKLDGSAKKPSAFTRPLRVSPELSEWLGGQTEISRPELTKRFWAYAKVMDVRGNFLTRILAASLGWQTKSLVSSLVSSC